MIRGTVPAAVAGMAAVWQLSAPDLRKGGS